MKDNLKKKRISDTTQKKKLSDTIGTTNDKPPVYSFSNFSDSKHGLGAEPVEIRDLVKHLKTLGQTTWQVIQNSQMLH